MEKALINHGATDRPGGREANDRRGSPPSFSAGPAEGFKEPTLPIRRCQLTEPIRRFSHEPRGVSRPLREFRQ